MISRLRRGQNAFSCQKPARLIRFRSSLVGSNLAILLLLLITACQPGSLEPPRAATSTAQAALGPTHTPTPLNSSAPTATPGGSGDPAIIDTPAPNDLAEELTLWVTVSTESEMEALEEGVGEFTSETGIQIELVQVAPRLLPELMQTALISGTLPDLVLHPLDYTHGWYEQGILDAGAATTVLDSLGRGTFEPGALAQLEVGNQSGTVAALPSSGWQQLLLYRTDWFNERQLSPPDSFEKLAAAAEAIHEEDSPVSGLIVPTDSSLVSTQQVFEHMAIANGCRLVSPEGEIALLDPACLEALEFYRALVNAYSPIGLQTDISALNGYLSGRTGIIIAPPAVLPAIANLSDLAAPSCPECTAPDFLSRNTGIVSNLQGQGESALPANFSTVTALGITSAANKPAASAFSEYWFETLYPDWILLNPAQKVPMRRGTNSDPSLFTELWTEAPLVPDGATVADIFGPDSIESLSMELAEAERWGLARGQGALVSTLYEDLLFAPLLQDMLSGYFSSSETIVEMYLSAVDAMPGYNFPVQVAPSPTP